MFMPTYLYLCPDVHGEFECEHSIKESLEECPKCKEEGLEPKKVTRLISGGTNFILSGGGWAREGYS
jgi:putative FmdB family regulatory protein